MDEIEKQRWLSKDAWSEKETAWLLCGSNYEAADNAPRSADFNQASEALRRAVLTKRLRAIEPEDASDGDRLYGHHRFFDPAAVIAWAGDRFPNFPLQGMATLQEAQPAKESAKERNLRHRVIGALLNSRGEWPTSGKHFAQILEKHGCRIGEKTAKTILDEAREQISS